MRITALTLLSAALWAACQQTAPSSPKLPSVPEEVVRAWQQAIDQNRFELARQLSTGEALAYINELAALNTGSDSLDWENNVMFDLRCQISGDSAHCTYHFEDEMGEPMPGQLALRCANGQWLVSRTDFETDVPAADTLRAVFPDDEKE